MKAQTWHLLQLCIAWLMISVGVVFLFSPIPIGILLIAVGLSFLVAISDEVAEKVRGFRARHGKFNQQLLLVEIKLNRRIHFVSEAMRKTRPLDEEPVELDPNGTNS